MGAHDGQVPAPRRAGLSGRLPLRRRPADVLPQPAADTPRVAEISALLSDIDALRTTLTTDLSLAAAALESGADDLAAELVSGDVDALHGFEQRALAHLRALDTAPVSSPALPEPLVALRRPMHRRMLPAAPVLAAAAALVGILAGALPAPTSGASPAPAMSNAAATSDELRRLARVGAPSDALREVAEALNDQLAALVAVAGTDPAAAQQAMLLLNDTTRILAGAQDKGGLAAVLAETQALVARLAAVLPTTTVRPKRATRPAVPLLPLGERARRSSGSGASTSDSTGTRTAPSSRPQPSAATTPAPAPAPQASPSAAPPSPTSSPTPPGPILPRAGSLPGAS